MTIMEALVALNLLWLIATIWYLLDLSKRFDHLVVYTKSLHELLNYNYSEKLNKNKE